MSFDTVEDNAAFVKKFHFPFALLCDVDGALAKAYGAFGKDSPKYALRNTYLVGPDGKIEKVWEKVNPTKNPQEVLDAVPGE